MAEGNQYTATMSTDSSEMSQKMAQIGEKLENSCLDLVKMRHSFDEISAKTLKRSKEKVESKQKLDDKIVQYKTEYETKRTEIESAQE